jgi:hypothetical protein
MQCPQLADWLLVGTSPENLTAELLFDYLFSSLHFPSFPFSSLLYMDDYISLLNLPFVYPSLFRRFGNNRANGGSPITAFFCEWATIFLPGRRNVNPSFLFSTSFVTMSPSTAKCFQYLEGTHRMTPQRKTALEAIPGWKW